MKTGLARVSAGIVPAILGFGLILTVPLAWAQQHTTAPADGEPRRLTIEQLRDGLYRLPLLGDEETPIRFRGGQRSIRYGAGATERVEAGLVGDLAAFGDLDGDDVADAAVVAFVNTGGSGTFIHLLAVREREGAPVQAGRQFLGDRVRVKSLAVSGGHVFVTMDAHAPDDGLCCPSIATSRAFTLSGRRLVPTRALVIASPLPGETVATGVEVRGSTTHPPADGLAYLVYDARGGVIGLGRIPVDASSGTFGTFAAPVSFLAGDAGPGRIEIVDVRSGDGSALVRASVPVLLDAAEAARRPVQPQIVLEAPLSGAPVGRSVEVRGWISVAPFENNLTYRVYSEGGVVIDRSWIMAEGDLGDPGTFAKSITLANTLSPGPIRIEVRDVDQADGSLFTSTTVQVFYTGRRSLQDR